MSAGSDAPRMVSCREADGTCRAAIRGEMTIYHAAGLKGELMAVLGDERPLEIDLGEVVQIDTAGAQLLMAAKRERARMDRTLALVNHSEAVLECFELLGLIGYFKDPVVLSGRQGDRDES